MRSIVQHGWRLAALVFAIVLLTYCSLTFFRVNATTAGFGYLLLVLIVASTWGFLEAAFASILATLAFNYYFFSPIGTLTIADPQNWVALFSFLSTSLIGSRLSAIAKRRASDALARQRDLERLYTFSRAILLIEGHPFPKLLAQNLAGIFELSGVVLYDRGTGDFHKAGPHDLDGLTELCKTAAVQGTSFSDAANGVTITAVRLGSEPIASLAIQSQPMPDSVVQGIANLVAIGLERARAQDLAQQVEVVQRTEQLRTILVDAMAHEFKTPLTAIKAATTSLLSNPDQASTSRLELLQVADEEADHLVELIDSSLEMARLDASKLDLRTETVDFVNVIRDVVSSRRVASAGRSMTFADGSPILVDVDVRLIKLAVQQLLDNALKYSPPASSIDIRALPVNGNAVAEVTDHGLGIPDAEQARIFERFYRSPAVRNLIPGSGLGLSIAQRIAEAHRGHLTVASRPGETTFRIMLPLALEKKA